MSEVLVRQLQQVLAPWDSLMKDHEGTSSGTSPSEITLDNWGSVSTQDALAHARTATTKLELARAALALFTSNAGAFRPILVKVFRFLFDHVDELRDEVAHSAMERLVWQQGENQRAAASGTGLSPNTNELGATPEEQNAVVAAYEKVRLTESRMAALIEEASVQRDHFKSQIENHKKQQYHLEDLLQHQMELTQTLLDHRLRQELVGGGVSAVQCSGGEGNATTAAPPPSFGTTLPTLGGDERDGNATGGKSPQANGTSPVPIAERKADPLGVEIAERARHPAEHRDAAYVQRLIQRAERELTLEKTEDQLRELRAQQDLLENKVQSLLKLNTKYARQCVELSARLSIIHENNIALSADVQLYQRDYLKEQQRSANLQHALHVARGIVLTTLQVQPGYHANEMLEKLEVIEKTAADTQWKRFEDNNSSLTQQSRWCTVSPKLSRTSPKKGGTDKRAFPPLFSPQPQLDNADEIGEALRAVPQRNLRSELKELLLVDDVEYSCKIKAALLKLLELQTISKVQLDCNGVSTADAAAVSATDGKASEYWLFPLYAHNWSPPYGLRPSVPRHLRSSTAVPLLFLHPLLAEVFVHELLTQRQQLLAFAQAKSLAWTASAKKRVGGTSPKGLDLQQPQFGTVARTNNILSLPEFIELFILVVWLNRADRFLPLLPSPERKRLEEEALAREEAYERRISKLVVKGAVPGHDKRKPGGGGEEGDSSNATIHVTHLTLWELRHVLHLIRPSIDAVPLPYEGLQLTYALDAASQQVHAGPLTYAYGLTSRGALCEVLLYVLRAERETLLHLCRAVDAAMVTYARAQHSKPPTTMTDGENRSPSSTTASPPSDPPKLLNEWIPTVQFIRILLVMFPGYSASKLEELIAAAVSDGTVGAESPATLFYEVLLPGRMLPGPTTATTAVDMSVATSTKFASVFYAAICDDAVASMQMVEDSVYNFARGHLQCGSEVAGHTGAAAAGDPFSDGSDGVASVTARQINASSFLGIPRLEAQQWGAGLRSAINRWPRLRRTIADPGRASTESANEKTGELTEADQVSTVARVSIGDVVPYLRKNIIVRRGVFANSDVAAAAPLSPVVSPSSVANVIATTANSLTASDTLSSNATSSQKGATNESLTGKESSSPVQLEGWTPLQARLLQRWEAQWARYGNLPPGSATVLAGRGGTPSFLGGPSQVAEYVELLQQFDPCRARPWGSELVSRDNPVLHPLDYVGDWSLEALGIDRSDNTEALASVAAKKEPTKSVKKDTKKASGTR